MSYEQITQEEAKQIMDTTNGYILLDTRTREEYDQSHIISACPMGLPLALKIRDVVPISDAA